MHNTVMCFNYLLINNILVYMTFLSAGQMIYSGHSVLCERFTTIVNRYYCATVSDNAVQVHLLLK